MLMNKYFLVCNPGSGRRAADKKLRKIRNLLDSNRMSYDYAMTQTLDHATELSASANRKGYEVIVAVGGDGTINRVINGFYNRDGKKRSQAKLGVIYSGTSPDFCKSYRIPIKTEESVRTLQRGHTTDILIGRMTCAVTPTEDPAAIPDPDLSGFRTGHFACCANIGLGASLARHANSGIRRVIGDIPGTFISLIRVLARFKPVELYIRMDGTDDHLKNVFNVSIGRTVHVASGMKINHSIASATGRFYTLAVRNLTVRNVFGALRTMYRGLPVSGCSAMTLNYARYLDIRDINAGVEVEYDGDPAGYLPCRIEPAGDLVTVITDPLLSVAGHTRIESALQDGDNET